RLWTSNDDVVYALGFNPQGKLLIGAGNQGRIFQLESDHVYSLLRKAAPAQITAFLQEAGGRVLVATANVGKVYGLGPEIEPKGTFESDVFDAAIFSRWGRLHPKATLPHGATLTLYARSGNLSGPAQYWSKWSSPVRPPEGAPVDCPPARFVQWKAVLETSGAALPVLDSVTLAYQPKNIAPTISDLEVTPPNHKFADPPVTASSTQTLTLPALGAKPAPPLTVAPQPVRTMNAAKGYLGVRWLAQDENEDDLAFRIEIRGVNEQNWKVLKEKVEQQHFSWDSTAFADGWYRVRVTASDAPSNPGPAALTYTKESEPFVIDNTPPLISAPAAAIEGGRIRVRFHVADALSEIDRSEYSVDGGEWQMMLPATHLFDSRELDYDFLTPEVKPGEHTIAIRVWDANDNLATAKAVVGRLP
ncbi:MAG: hypothetical protein HY238_02185, partial [Acidobacteria bacterium]|nr:hypothetical protein [Acidobacteriota bacterium]